MNKIAKKKKNKYSINSKQAGEALELLSSLESNSVELVFCDPQSDYQIMRIIEQVSRVLKPSSFCCLWINKGLLGSDRIAAWLIKAPQLKIVDCLVWYKKNTLGLGTWLRSNAEFCFLLQKTPTTGKKFTNRSFGTVWEESSLPTNQRKHSHQKPKKLIKTLILAATQEKDLIIDSCAGSFIVLEVCHELKRDYLGYDLTFREMGEFMGEK